VRQTVDGGVVDVVRQGHVSVCRLRNLPLART
jgi:hypothetical protein